MAHFENSLAAHYNECIYEDKLDFFNCVNNWPEFLKDLKIKYKLRTADESVLLAMF